jgi:hypothetical protein
MSERVDDQEARLWPFMSVTGLFKRHRDFLLEIPSGLRENGFMGGHSANWGSSALFDTSGLGRKVVEHSTSPQQRLGLGWFT